MFLDLLTYDALASCIPIIGSLTYRRFVSFIHFEVHLLIGILLVLFDLEVYLILCVLLFFIQFGGLLIGVLLVLFDLEFYLLICELLVLFSL